MVPGQWALPPQKRAHIVYYEGMAELDYFIFFVQVYSYFLSFLKFQRFPNILLENIDPCPQLLMLER